MVHTYLVHNTYPTLKPRLVEHTHNFFFWDAAIRNSLRSNNCRQTHATVIGMHLKFSEACSSQCFVRRPRTGCKKNIMHGRPLATRDVEWQDPSFLFLRACVVRPSRTYMYVFFAWRTSSTPSVRADSSSLIDTRYNL